MWIHIFSTEVQSDEFTDLSKILTLYVSMKQFSACRAMSQDNVLLETLYRCKKHKAFTHSTDDLEYFDSLHIRTPITTLVWD